MNRFNHVQCPNLKPRAFSLNHVCKHLSILFQPPKAASPRFPCSSVTRHHRTPKAPKPVRENQQHRPSRSARNRPEYRTERRYFPQHIRSCGGDCIQTPEILEVSSSKQWPYYHSPASKASNLMRVSCLGRSIEGLEAVQ